MIRFKKALELSKPRKGALVTKSSPGPSATGRLTILRAPIDADPDDKDAWEVVEDSANLVVAQAGALMAQMAVGAANSELSYIELGDPTAPATEPDSADTTLQQTTGVRAAVTTSVSDNVVTCTMTLGTGDGNGNVYTEAGLFTGVLGSGTMFARKTFPGIAKTASFQLSFVWAITFLADESCCGSGGLSASLLSPTTNAQITQLTSTGGEASIAANFDFPVGSNLLEVYIAGVRQYPGVHYSEVDSASLTAPTLGSSSNKGINLSGWTLPAGVDVMLYYRKVSF